MRAPDLLRSPERLVGWMLVAATLLALIMACTEGINDRPDMWRGPPDEYGHRAAARYYVNHWLPPKAGDPATLDSYSRDYGYSYINDPDPVYPLAGRFAALLAPIVANHDLAMRLFNVTLLGLIALLALLRPAAWPIFAPLLLTPQVWYIFSYFNGDGLPLFLTVLLAYQVAFPTSLLNRYLDDGTVKRAVGVAILMGVLLGLFALSKKNYLAFAAFLPAALAWRRFGTIAAVLLAASAIAAAAYSLQWISASRETAYAGAAVVALAVLIASFAPPRTRRQRALAAAKLLLLLPLAAAIPVARYAWDLNVNGSIEQKLQVQGQLQEQFAKPEYKPSQVYQSKNQQATYYGLQLRARGTPLAEIFGPFWSWHTKTFTTLTGSYGWLTYNSPKPYAILLILGWLALAGAYLWSAARSRDASVVASVAIVVAFAALTVAVAAFHSWNDDFQAQGRYLFPVLGMLGAGLMYARPWLPLAWIGGATGACFLLSCYSFVFVGLREVERAF